MLIRINRALIKIIVLSSIMYFWGCANPVSPTGGPLDETPPQVVISVPPNYSTFFSRKRITLTFDEFVKLKNPNQQVLISPPFKNRPTYKLRGKTLIIDFDEDLYPNTTYSIFFGNAIVDLTEENPLSDYQFVFSTGAYIDSLELRGEVVDAFNLKPRENVFAMLFQMASDTVTQDSIPMLLLPIHVTKTDKEGKFRIQNLPDKEFILFALDDMNNNYRYDQPGEEIAFVDNLVRPEVQIPVRVNDTIANSDSLQIKINGFYQDSIRLKEQTLSFFKMFMFRQVDSTQRRIALQAFYPPSFQLVYRMPLINPRIFLLNDSLIDDWKIMQPGVIGDTLMVWLNETSTDTLRITVWDDTTPLDTLMVAFTRAREQFERSSRPRRGAQEKVSRLEVKNNLRGRTLDPGRNFRLFFNEPLVSYNFNNVFFVAGKDTMNGAPLVPANVSNTVFKLDYTMEEDTWYEFIFPDSILFNIHNITNDSLKVSFTTGKISDFGKLILNINIPENEAPFVVQLMDDKEKVLKEVYLESSGKVEFEYLRPGNYIVKAIEDAWRNRRWDTGVYVNKRQPERVFYYPGAIQVRANWDVEEDWNLP